MNVAESYVKKGGIMIGKSNIRVNDYADIDTAGAHPNCSCVDKYGIEDNGEDEIFDYSKLDRKDPEYISARAGFLRKTVEEF
ncbi:MAG: hypothetical protein Q4A27_00795 [bacterium]|nr:hypothetical protein [bacterium]